MEAAILCINQPCFASLDAHISVCAAFLDIKKDFDSAPHKPLLDAMSSLLSFSLTLLAHILLYRLFSEHSQYWLSFFSMSYILWYVPGIYSRSTLLHSIPFSSSSTLTLYADETLLFHPLIPSSSIHFLFHFLHQRNSI